MLGILTSRLSLIFIFTFMPANLSLLVAEEMEYEECYYDDIDFDNLDDIDFNTRAKNELHATANFFGIRLFGSRDCVVSNVITFMPNNSGIMCHIAWYGDAYILTFMHGPDEGKQIIFLNNFIFESAYPSNKFKGGVTHEYSWGRILTLYQCQEVKFTEETNK